MPTSRIQQVPLSFDVAAPLVSRGSPSQDHRFQDGLDARHAVERRGQGSADPVVSVTHPPPSPLNAAEEAVQGWSTTPEFGHEDERTRAARRLLCWCSLLRNTRVHTRVRVEYVPTYVHVYVHPGVSAKAGEAVKGAVQGLG
jgi:hypothetical protein